MEIQNVFHWIICSLVTVWIQLFLTPACLLGIQFFICIFFTKFSWVPVKNKIKYSVKDIYIQAYVTGFFRWLLGMLTFCFSTVYTHWINFPISKERWESLIMLDDVGKTPGDKLLHSQNTGVSYRHFAQWTFQPLKLSFIHIFNVSWIKHSVSLLCNFKEKKKKMKKHQYCMVAQNSWFPHLLQIG